MTMPAMPMKLAALRYSPEMAEAFQPTETERPATKKSDADFEVFAERKPIQMVAMTVIPESARIQGLICEKSMMAGRAGSFQERRLFSSAARRTSAASRAIERVMNHLAMIHT